MKKQCDKHYEVLYLNRLEEVCNRKDLHARYKREPITIMGIVVVSVLASVGIGLSGYAISKTFTLQTGQDELKQALDDIERKVFIENKSRQTLQLELRKVTLYLDTVVKEQKGDKENAVEIQYIISHLANKLIEGKRTIKETGESWKKKKINSDFFDYLNFSIPCSDVL